MCPAGVSDSQLLAAERDGSSSLRHYGVLYLLSLNIIRSYHLISIHIYITHIYIYVYLFVYCSTRWISEVWELLVESGSWKGHQICIA